MMGWGRVSFTGFLSVVTKWWRSPPLLDQFLSLPDSDILELTEDMIYRPDPFGRFKRMLDAQR